MSGKEKEISASNGIIGLLDDLIKQIKENQSLVAAIRGRIGAETRWHGFGFDTMVKDVLGSNFIASMKQARCRVDANSDDKNNSNYTNLVNLYNEARKKYFGLEDLPKIQSISDDVLRETKKLGIDWESEMKKFSDHLNFKNRKL